MFGSFLERTAHCSSTASFLEGSELQSRQRRWANKSQQYRLTALEVDNGVDNDIANIAAKISIRFHLFVCTHPR